MSHTNRSKRYGKLYKNGYSGCNSSTILFQVPFAITIHRSNPRTHVYTSTSHPNNVDANTLQLVHPHISCMFFLQQKEYRRQINFVCLRKIRDSINCPKSHEFMTYLQMKVCRNTLHIELPAKLLLKYFSRSNKCNINQSIPVDFGITIGR